jgi:hypothetical protein
MVEEPPSLIRKKPSNLLIPELPGMVMVMVGAGMGAVVGLTASEAF